MTCTLAFSSFSDDQLLDEVKRLAVVERSATATLVRALMEFDTRRLYLGAGCSSLFTYCTQVLHLCEGAAYNRIEAARAARRFPLLLEGLEDGSLTLTAVRLLAPHLTAENHREVLAAARLKGKREVEQLIAALAPKPAAATVIRKVPESRAAAAQASGPPVSTMAQGPRTEYESGAVTTPPAVVKPLAPTRYKVQLTISGETHDKLRRVQDLLRHTLADGDPAAIFDRALSLLLDHLESRRFAATSSPRAPRDATPASRHIPAAIRREVWRRDQGRCAFVGTHGRCTERGFLEFHHVEPYAMGGAATIENLQLRCRAHNAYEAALLFGDDGPATVRESRAEWLL